jgi:hypothetical protein
MQTDAVSAAGAALSCMSCLANKHRGVALGQSIYMNVFMGVFRLSGEPWAIIVFQTFAGIAPTIRQRFRRAQGNVFSKGDRINLMRRIPHFFPAAKRQLFSSEKPGPQYNR